MTGGGVPVLAKKLKEFRYEPHITQKEAADKSRITGLAYRVYELGDCNSKSEILDKIADVLGVRPEFLSAPTFRNRREFAYALLENENVFRHTVRDVNETAAITTVRGPTMNFFAEFITTGKGFA